MRAVVQRASAAEVRIDDVVVGRLARPGLVVLVGVTLTDGVAQADQLADKIWRLRILDDPVVGRRAGTERSAADLDAPLLVISQFTLYADTRRGRRPSWSAAAPGAQAEPLVERLVTRLRQVGATVETGRFGADMAVALTNDGPVTILLEV